MKTAAKAALDAIIAIGFLLLLEPKLGPLNLHEWGGLVICAFFIVHKCLNAAWIKTVTTKLISRDLPGRVRLNYILDLVLLVSFTMIALSGMAMAKTMDFSWLMKAQEGPLWHVMHGFASFLVLAVVGVHVGMHWDWIAARFAGKDNKEPVNERR